MNNKCILHFIGGDKMEMTMDAFKQALLEAQNSGSPLVTTFKDGALQFLINFSHVTFVEPTSELFGNAGVVNPPSPLSIKEQQEQERVDRVSSVDKIIEKHKEKADEVSTDELPE